MSAPRTPSAAPAVPKELDVLVISDQHLGVPTLLSYWQRYFLDTVTAGTIITAGDTRDHERDILHKDGVLKKIFRAARPDGLSENDLAWYDSRNAAASKGARLVELRGNHDDPLRTLDGQTRHGVQYAEQAEFTAGNGKKVAVIHGDQLDPALKHLTGFARGGLKALAAFADTVNIGLLAAGAAVARATQFLFGRAFNPYGAITTAAEVLTGRRASFDRKAARWALDHGKDVIVHGHLHDPHVTVFRKGDLVESFKAAARDGRAPRRADREITVIDVGDGVESSTALLVDKSGAFELRSISVHMRTAGRARLGTVEENKRLHRARSEAQVSDINRAFAGQAPLREVPASQRHVSGVIPLHPEGPPDVGTLRAG